ncbi:hypothetical protein AAJ76_400021091 [Vairimorpha ceranae]|uniref:Uncharacterized protein n=1 Tax=Vairimorpha ceranae TaxID=40302 RepID=A0A0F9ZG34_9MICR|nr:hypothetical protein AAJ76_400021091 [Vairimorpha ceranae]KKO76309.1 hypothetical protein AAJ76_400021091 [Vairimorpha ceranae]
MMQNKKVCYLYLFKYTYNLFQKKGIFFLQVKIFLIYNSCFDLLRQFCTAAF